MLVLSQYVEEGYALALLGDGAEGIGYLLKDRVAEVERFTDAIRRVAARRLGARPRGRPAPDGPARAARTPLAELTPREREVLGLMAEGRSNAAIAARARRHRARRGEARDVDLREARPAARRRASPPGARGARLDQAVAGGAPASASARRRIGSSSTPSTAPKRTSVPPTSSSQNPPRRGGPGALEVLQRAGGVGVRQIADEGDEQGDDREPGERVQRGRAARWRGAGRPWRGRRARSRAARRSGGSRS